MRHLFILGLVVLAGCASARPPMSDAAYPTVASDWTTINACGRAGYLDPDTAALGQDMIRTYLMQKTVNQQKLEEAIKASPAQQVTRERCNDFAMGIASRKRQIAIHNASVDAEQKATQDAINNRPKQTYCNRIGTQTLCSSY
jgi:hypothetical protein